MHLYLAAYEKATADPGVSDAIAFASLREAWDLACSLKERSMAEYVFEKLEPYLNGDEIARCAHQLQALALDPQALFMLVEGLDPVCLVCADGETAKVLGAAYRTSFKSDAATRVFGRPAAIFRSLDALMESPEGKRSAWAVLKTFPKRA